VKSAMASVAQWIAQLVLGKGGARVPPVVVTDSNLASVQSSPHRAALVPLVLFCKISNLARWVLALWIVLFPNGVSGLCALHVELETSPSASEPFFVRDLAVVLVVQATDISKMIVQIFLAIGTVPLARGEAGQDAQFCLVTASNHDSALPHKRRLVRAWTARLCLIPSGATTLHQKLASLVLLLTSLALSPAKLLVLQSPTSFAIVVDCLSLSQIPELLWRLALIWTSWFLVACLLAQSIVLLKHGADGLNALTV